jgi:hypothetical protein
MRIKEEVNKLKSQDIYSLMLFALFKLKDVPEYSSLSELVYILDKGSLLKLCEYFGGMTIKIPTIKELESMVYLLLLYQYVNVENIEYSEAVKLIGIESSKLRQIKSQYAEMCKILDQYDFVQEK